jgi:hypothetical protein
VTGLIPISKAAPQLPQLGPSRLLGPIYIKDYMDFCVIYFRIFVHTYHDCSITQDNCSCFDILSSPARSQGLVQIEAKAKMSSFQEVALLVPETPARALHLDQLTGRRGVMAAVSCEQFPRGLQVHFHSIIIKMLS